MVKIGIISGFLGAGKTTLIIKLMEEVFAGKKVAIIENEMGDVNFDGKKIKKEGGFIREISAGCVCCTLLQDFRSTIEELEKNIKPDYILVEPSGSANLPAVQEAIRRACQGKEQVDFSITVADAQVCTAFIEQFGDFYRNQLAYAGGIVLSHIDECENEELQLCLETVKNVAPEVPVFCLTWDQLPAKELVELAQKQQKSVSEKKYVKEFAPKVTIGGALQQSMMKEKSQVFSSVTIPTEHIFTKKELESCLKECREMSEMYGRVLRIKGNVKSNQGYYTFECITGRDYIEESMETEKAIVVIGQDLRKEQLLRLFTEKRMG